MQVEAQATNSATNVEGSTSGMNTWLMPTDLAFVNQLRSSSLTVPPRASVSEIRRLRSCERTQ